MRRIVVLLLALVLAFMPTAASAHHSMAGGVGPNDCGTLSYHLEEDYVKGTSDALIWHVDFTNGCARINATGLTAAGIGEAQGNDEQMARCVRDGRDAIVNGMRWYFDREVDASKVEIPCTKYSRRS